MELHKKHVLCNIRHSHPSKNHKIIRKKQIIMIFVLHLSNYYYLCTQITISTLTTSTFGKSK